MTTLTKEGLINGLIAKTGMSPATAKKIVSLFFETIKQHLEKGENIKLSGFGHFKIRDKSARPGRNPKTGESYEIAARRVVTFHASPKLKDRVAQQQEDQSE